MRPGLPQLTRRRPTRSRSWGPTNASSIILFGRGAAQFRKRPITSTRTVVIGLAAAIDPSSRNPWPPCEPPTRRRWRVSADERNMSMKCVRRLVGWLGVLLLCSPAQGQEPTMVAHYIDVGQGLSVLLEFPCGAVLIDTGSQDAEHIDSLSGYLRDFFVRRADLGNTLNTLI